MVKIRIGGVPEHFNLPVQLAIDNGKFKAEGIDLQWINYPGGTGDMTRALENNEADLCIVLTEGITTAIKNGNPSKIISGYVKTPLIWGIHTGINSAKEKHNDVFESKIAISRKGSGSHLMPTVDALMKDKKIDNDQFIVVSDINGAIKSLNDGSTDIFYWEKYTTKPYVEKNILRRIGEFASPWPCFVIAATNEIIESKPTVVDKILRIIHAECEEFMQSPDSADLVSDRYDIQKTDARYWFHSTEWAVDSWVSDKMLQSVLFTLMEAEILPKTISSKDLVWIR